MPGPELSGVVDIAVMKTALLELPVQWRRQTNWSPDCDNPEWAGLGQGTWRAVGNRRDTWPSLRGSERASWGTEHLKSEGLVKINWVKRGRKMKGYVRKDSKEHSWK